MTKFTVSCLTLKNSFSLKFDDFDQLYMSLHQDISHGLKVYEWSLVSTRVGVIVSSCIELDSRVTAVVFVDSKDTNSCFRSVIFGIKPFLATFVL